MNYYDYYELWISSLSAFRNTDTHFTVIPTGQQKSLYHPQPYKRRSITPGGRLVEPASQSVTNKMAAADSSLSTENPAKKEDEFNEFYSEVRGIRSIPAFPRAHRCRRACTILSSRPNVHVNKSERTIPRIITLSSKSNNRHISRCYFLVLIVLNEREWPHRNSRITLRRILRLRFVCPLTYKAILSDICICLCFFRRDVPRRAMRSLFFTVYPIIVYRIAGSK